MLEQKEDNGIEIDTTVQPEYWEPVDFKPEFFELVKIEKLDVKEKRQKIVNTLMSRYNFVTLPNDDLYIYKNGIYTLYAEHIIKQAAVYSMGLDYSREDYLNVLDRIKAQTFNDNSFFDAPPNLIAVENGILNIKNSWVEEYSQKNKYHFLSKLAITFKDESNWAEDDTKEWSRNWSAHTNDEIFTNLNTENETWTDGGTDIDTWTKYYAKCNPKTGQLIYDILPSRQAVRFFYELLGYCLYRGYPIHKAFMFVGEGSNGKSTLLNLIKMFLGALNTCSISLQSLCEDRFSRAELYGKMLNFFADLKDFPLTETGEFKALTGNDQISAEIKFKQKHITFTNTAKFAFSCNKIPENKGDDSDAFWRRWIIVQFTQTFDEEKGNVKHDILENLFNYEYGKDDKESEFEALLAHAILGLKRLLKNGKFSSDNLIVIDGKEKVRDAWTRNDTVRGFSEECIMQGEYIPKSKVFDAYITYQKENFPNMPPLDMGVFHRKLRKHVAVYDTQVTIDCQRINCYGGIALKPKEQPKDQQSTL